MVFEGQGEGKIGGVRVWNRECIIQNIRLLTIKTTLIQLRRWKECTLRFRWRFFTCVATRIRGDHNKLTNY